MDWDVICGNSGDVLKTLEADSIDLTVTSPPYDDLRTYHGFSWDFDLIAEQLFRVTKPGGVVVWVVGDQSRDNSETGSSFRQALGFMDHGFKLYDTMIYKKAQHIPLQHRRYEQEFEFMFVLSKGRPETFNPIMIPCKMAGKITGGAAHRETWGPMAEPWKWEPIKEQKIKGNVWEYKVGAGCTKDRFAYEHPAMFPERLAADHITSWSNKGDTVLDPFCGSGTTGKMAHVLGRQFIGIEIDPQFADLSRRRIATYSTMSTPPNAKTPNRRRTPISSVWRFRWFTGKTSSPWLWTQAS